MPRFVPITSIAVDKSLSKLQLDGHHAAIRTRIALSWIGERSVLEHVVASTQAVKLSGKAGDLNVRIAAQM